MKSIIDSTLYDNHSGELSLGYYQVGNTKHIYKLKALVEATRQNIHPEWNFHRDAFSKVNWTISSNTDLRAVYARRAQQLRDQYEHLTLHYSGGSDSYTVLRAFLDNNIHLDEVFVRWPIKATEKLYTPNAADTSTANILSEWDLIIKPDLEYLRKHHPTIKITVVDWSEDATNLDEFSEELFDAVGSDFLNFGVFFKHLTNSDTEKQRFSKGLKTASIFGLDKCRVVKQGNDAFVYFLDIAINMAGSQKNKNIEPFYWTPSMPDVVKEQAHLVFNYFSARPELQHLLDFESYSDPVKKRQYDLIVRSLVYPDWNPNKFQAAKGKSAIYTETDTWLFNQYRGHRILDSWQVAVKNQLATIDKKYIRYNNGVPDGFVGFISPFYQIGGFKQVDH